MAMTGSSNRFGFSSEKKSREFGTGTLSESETSCEEEGQPKQQVDDDNGNAMERYNGKDKMATPFSSKETNYCIGSDYDKEDRRNIRHKTATTPSDAASVVMGSSPVSNNRSLATVNHSFKAFTQASTNNENETNSEAPGAHAIAGMRASELNSYADITTSPRDSAQRVRALPSDVLLDEDRQQFDTYAGPGRHNSTTSINNCVVVPMVQMQEDDILTAPAPEKSPNIFCNSENLSGIASFKVERGNNKNRRNNNVNNSNNRSHVDEDVEMAIEVKAVAADDHCRTWFQSRRGKFCLICTVVFVLAGVTIAAVVLFASPNKRNVSKNLNQMEYIQNLLLESDAVSNSTAFEDPSSMEHQVVAWLAYEDPHQIDPMVDRERIVQRYTARYISMIVLEDYDIITSPASTSGTVSQLRKDSNTDQRRHLDINAHECNWTIQMVNVTDLETEPDTTTPDDDNVPPQDLPESAPTEEVLVTSHGRPPMINFTLSCNSQQQITSLSILDIKSPVAVPYEIGNLIHLESAQLKTIVPAERNWMGQLVDIEESKQRQSFVKPLIQLQNLSMLDVHIDTASGDSLDNLKTLIEGIHHLTQLRVLEIDGGLAPVPHNITSLPSIVEFVVIKMNDVGNGKPLFEENFFSDFKSLSTLQKLVIQENVASWNIPNDIQHMTNLTHLTCTNNPNLSGTIPDVFEHMKNLRVLDLSYNNFTGPIPKSILSLNQLERINLEGNNLDGDVILKDGHLELT